MVPLWTWFASQGKLCIVWQLKYTVWQLALRVYHTHGVAPAVHTTVHGDEPPSALCAKSCLPLVGNTRLDNTLLLLLMMCAADAQVIALYASPQASDVNARGGTTISGICDNPRALKQLAKDTLTALNHLHK